MTLYDPAPQQTDGWLKARLGWLTGSRMNDALAFTKKGESEARRKLKVELLAERLTDCAMNHYVTPAMQWGIEQESFAKSRYEQETGTLITPCGFAAHSTIPYFGASPDGLIGKEGVFECKCPTTQTHIQWLLAGEVPEQHKPQMLAQMSVTERRWCDFVSFDPRVPEKQQFFLRRYEPTLEEIAAVEAAARTFLAELEEMWDRLIMDAG